MHADLTSLLSAIPQTMTYGSKAQRPTVTAATPPDKMQTARGGEGGKGKPAATAKDNQEAWGIDTLNKNEERCITGGDPVTDEHLNRICGLMRPVRHPSRTTGKDVKGGGQQWNQDCFMGLGWKGDEDSKKGQGGGGARV
jgi:hypothetical protein